jgi:hypothetical protein
MIGALRNMLPFSTRSNESAWAREMRTPQLSFTHRLLLDTDRFVANVTPWAMPATVVGMGTVMNAGCMLALTPMPKAVCLAFGLAGAAAAVAGVATHVLGCCYGIVRCLID